MKKQLLLSLSIFFFLPTTLANAKRTTLQRILQKGEITVCARKDIPPFGFVAKKKWQGFDLQLSQHIVKYIAKQRKNPIKVKWNVVNALTRLGELLGAKCDLVVAAFSVTPERKQYVAFSDVYLTAKKVILARKKIKRNKPVMALVQGTTHQIARLSGVVKSFHSYLAIIKGMKNNTVDYTITDGPIARFMLNRVGSTFLITKTLKQKEKYGIGMRKQDTDLLKVVNKALAALKKSGDFKKLISKWL